MDRYNALVSRHLMAAVIEVGQAKGGVALDTDAMADWLAALPAKERSNLARVLMQLRDCVLRANGGTANAYARDGGEQCHSCKRAVKVL